VIQKLARAGSHGGNNIRGLTHFAHGENCDFGKVAMDQFDGANGSLRILGIDTHQDDFGVLILQLTQNRIARSGGETDMAQHGSGQVGALDPAVQCDGLFAILSEEGDGDPGHDSILRVHYYATKFQRRGQMTFVIEDDLR
jgi:hypothetical protein